MWLGGPVAGWTPRKPALEGTDAWVSVEGGLASALWEEGAAQVPPQNYGLSWSPRPAPSWLDMARPLRGSVGGLWSLGRWEGA